MNVGVAVLGYLFVAAAFHIAAATEAPTSVNVNPQFGNDSEGCGAVASPCRTISFAVRNVNTSISSLRLSEGIFHESTIIISGMHSLVISGVLSSTVFDCSHRLQPPGAAFHINNSSVVISGISFQNCSNPNSTGGALSCSNSSVVVSQCSFTNCSAVSGGAISLVGPGDSLFLLVKDTSFFGNSAMGGSVGCPNNQMQPCSTWGGGIAAFEIFNVTISGCRMVANFAQAFVSRTSSQHFASRNAVAGGGCVSVLYLGNASRSSVLMSDNTFEGCEVDVSTSRGNLQIGNGMFDFFTSSCKASLIFRALVFNQCAGYGGAVSVYFGLYAGRHLLNVSLFDFLLLRNVFTRCVVIVNSRGGNSYGGGVSVYIGGYFSSWVATGTSASEADIGDTIVRNVSMTIHAAKFASCMSNRSADNMLGGNVYGGSFSFYTGPYVWSLNTAGSSKSTCGVTTVSSVTVSISDSPSHNCIAVATSRKSSFGASTYGGSLSAMYIGGYSWSYSRGEVAGFVSNSICGALNVNDIRVSISDSPCFNCGAVSTIETESRTDGSYGASSFGGSISAVHIGAYVWSFSVNVLSDSTSAATSVSGVHVSITNVSCINSRAATTIRNGESFAAIARSGSINTVHIGAYSWSYSGVRSRGSSSTCGATSADGLIVNVSDAPCFNCSAVTTAGFQNRVSYGASSSAGSLSAVHIGAYSWSYNGHSGRSSSTCQETRSNFINVSVAFASCFDCCAVTNITGFASTGATSNGGSIDAVHIGAYSWSWTQGGLFESGSRSFCDFNNVRNLAVFISRSAIARSMAIISKCQRSCL